MRSFSPSQWLRHPCIPASLLRHHSLLSADAGHVNTTGNMKCSNCSHTVKECDTVQGNLFCQRSRKCFESARFTRCHSPWQMTGSKKAREENHLPPVWYSRDVIFIGCLKYCPCSCPGDEDLAGGVDLHPCWNAECNGGRISTRGDYCTVV